MAKYRMVHTEFWNDPKVVEEMTPEDKYFFLYLLTNSSATQCGIYQITKKQMAFDLGHSIETVNALLDRFINHHKTVRYNYETREIAIKNWGKYNLNNGGKPVVDCVKSELEMVKDISLISFVGERIVKESIKKIYESYYEAYDVAYGDTSKKQESNNTNGFDDTSNDTSTSGGQKEKEKEKEKEEEEVKETEPTATSKNPIIFFENNLGMLSPFQMQELWDWMDQFNGQSEILIYAMQIALDRNKKNMGFVKYLLKGWFDKGAKTLTDVQALEMEHKGKGGGQSEQNNSGHFNKTSRETSLTGGKSGRLRKGNTVSTMSRHESNCL